MDNVENDGRAAPAGGVRGHRWLGRMGVGVLVVLALVVAACTPAAPTSSAGTPTAAAGAPPTTSPGGSAATPSITVNDQELLNGTVTVAEVVSDGPGWLTINAETVGGGPGALLGHTAVVTGTNTNVTVQIDLLNATQNLYAMLRVDAGKVGVFDYPAGPDIQVLVNGKPVEAPFMLELSSGEVGVLMQNIKFVPSEVAIAPGTTVTWTNTDDIQHSTTSDTGIWDSGLLSNGQTFSHTFADPGVYPYYCVLHGAPGGVGMSGTVVVIPPGG